MKQQQSLENQVQHSHEQQTIVLQHQVGKGISDKLFIIGYISWFCVNVIILVYCILSISLFSALSLLFGLVGIALIMAPAFSLKKVMDSNDYKLIPYRTEGLLWAIFSILKIIAFIVKLVLFYGDYDLSQPAKQFFEIQNAIYVYLPTLIELPFSIGSSFLRTRNQNLSSYQSLVNKANLFRIPIFLLIGFLMISLQFFTLSIVGIIFFCLLLCLYAEPNTSFSCLSTKIIVTTIQMFSLLVIVINYVFDSEILRNDTNYYSFYGINGLIDIENNSMNIGYMIQLILLFLLTSATQIFFRIVKYGTLAGLLIQNMDFSDILRDHGIINRPQSIVPQVFARSSQEQRIRDLTHVLMKKTSTQSDLKINKVTNMQQLQLQTISHKFQRTKSQGQNMKQKIRQQIDKQFEARKNEQIESQDEDLLEKIEKTQKNIQNKVWDLILDFLTRAKKGILNLFTSAEFSLRVAQFISIIVIQRYNNIYSFIALIWLAAVASIQNPRFIRWFTMLILLPVQVGNYLITYFYNIPGSPAQNSSDANNEKYGLQAMDLYQLDVAIFNVYIFWIISFLHISWKESRATRSTKKDKNLSLTKLIVAFVFKYTYILPLIAIFFLCFNQITLINLFFIFILLIFYALGDSVICEKKIHKERQYMTLTTVSRKYWFIINYYTLVCILAKYIYFLFFRGQIPTQLQPTGINEQFNWAFNFSLSSKCQSNTTPLFLIFFFSQVQSLVYRSKIYKNHSFSLVSHTTKIKMLKPYRQKIQKFISLSLELYYQTIYYISGLVILIFSERWSFFGLAMILLAGWGTLRGFTKKILLAIVVADLLFLFLTYIVQFINYTQIQSILGTLGIDIIKDICDFIGLIWRIKSEDNSGWYYYYYFLFYIIIYIFAVQSYALAKLLEQKRFEEFQNQQLLNLYSDSIIQSDVSEIEFARVYQRNVIEATQRCYNQCLPKKYKWFEKLSSFVTAVLMNCIVIVIIVQCLYFRLSVSMLLFLILYLIYYIGFLDQISSLLSKKKFYTRVLNQIANFSGKIKILNKNMHSGSIIETQNGQIDFSNTAKGLMGQKSQKQNESEDVPLSKIQQTIQFIKEIQRQTFAIKYAWKRKIWIGSCILSMACLTLAYCSQFLNFYFYINYAGQNSYATKIVKNTLFILGIYIDPDVPYANQMYFYYLMIFINILEKMIMYFVQWQKNEQIQLDRQRQRVKKNSICYEALQINNLENTDIEFLEEAYLEFLEDEQQPQQPQQQLQSNYEEELRRRQDRLYQNANILIYFDYKQTQHKIQLIYGGFNFLLRIYILVLLFNVYIKTNIFSFFYLLIAFIFWFKSLEFPMIRAINFAAICMLIAQYAILLLNITNDTSPIPTPFNPNLSLLDLIFGSDGSQWVSYLTTDGQQQNTALAGALIINSLVILFTQLYVFIFQWVSLYAISLIQQLYERYQYIVRSLINLKQGEQIYMNEEKYNPLFGRIIKTVIEIMITNSHVMATAIMIILLYWVQSYIGLAIVLVAYIYLCICLFVSIAIQAKMYRITQIYFFVLRAILFILLLISDIAYIPIIEDNIDNDLFDTIIGHTEPTQIILLFVLQIWLDLSFSDYFSQTTTQYHKNQDNRQIVLSKITAFQQNNSNIVNLMEGYKQALKFEISIIEATKLMQNWHEMMERNMQRLGKTDKYQLDIQGQEDIMPKGLQLLIEEVKQEMAQKNEDDIDWVNMIRQFLNSSSDLSLKLKYYGIMRYVIENTHSFLDQEQKEIHIWDYLIQDYGQVVTLIQKSESRLKQIAKKLQEMKESVQNTQEEEQFDLMLQIQQIFKEQFSYKRSFNPKKELCTPQLILPLPQKPEPWGSQIFFFFVSNFDYVVSFFFLVYYLLNPCLLSFPFIGYVFAFELISNRKNSYVMIAYIFVILALQKALVIQGYTGNGWPQYFFYLQPDGTYYFTSPYLIFLLVMILINEQIMVYKGLKNKNYQENENILQTFLRLLLNETAQSKRYLWKYKDDTFQKRQDTDENPYQYYKYKLSQSVNKLSEEGNVSFFDSFTQKRRGVDLYPYIAIIQIILTIYLILFPYMTQQDNGTLQNQLKYYTFNGYMVIAIICQVIAIVIERKITLLTGYPLGVKELIKYIFTMIILALVCLFLFYFAPYSGVSILDQIYTPRPALIAYGFIYFIYFFLSALQIKFGYKKFKMLNSFMTHRISINNIALQAVTNIPFLLELKTLMDWAFVETSLPIFQWFRLFTIYKGAFSAKMSYYSVTQTILGQPITWTGKLIGWIGFVLILVILLGPMIIFSNLNFLATVNPVIAGSLSLGIQIMGKNYFTLYSTSHFADAPSYFNSSTFNSMNFNQIPFLRTLSQTQIENQFQQVTFQQYADTFWGISPPNLEVLKQSIQTSAYQIENNQTTTDQYQLILTYSLTRNISSTTALDASFSYPRNETYLDNSTILSLNETLNCGQPTILVDLYNALIKLYTIGQSSKPSPISDSINGQVPYQYNAILGLQCSNVKSSNEQYWYLATNNSQAQVPGLQFYVVTDKVQNLTGGYSFIALYALIVGTIAGFVAGIFAGRQQLIPYYQNPKPDNILQIVEAISALRIQRQFREQFLMYYQLIDILRSPEIMKFMSGSYPQKIVEADKKRIEQQMKKSILQKKNQ